MRRTLAIAALVGVALLSTVAVALALEADTAPRGAERLTDNRTIDVVATDVSVRDVLWTPARPVDGAVNTAVDEYEPRIAGDGMTMVFVRRRPGSNADLLSAAWTPAGWSEPQPMAEINSDHDELGPELTFDGTRLYFYSDRQGGLGGYDLWVSDRASAKDPWSAPRNLGATVNSSANEYGPGLTPQGERLYFASNRPRPGEATALDGRPIEAWSATIRERRSRHDYDIYVADASDTGFRDALLVTELSTPADEGSPAISPAGDFLYFASDRPGGAGGYDIYRIRLAPADARAVSTVESLVEPLGPSINSPANELDPGLASEGFRLYFSSDRAIAAVAPPIDDVSAGRYDLFTSTSREVRRIHTLEQADRAGTFAGLWSSLWPWLLLLAILALLAYLLAKLFAHHDAWRQRIGTMGLLARCLLASILLHLLIAALLAAWKVGGLVADHFENVSEGGHRVILASAAPDSASGEIAQQVLAELTSTKLPDRSFEVAPSEVAAAAAFDMQARPVSVDPMVSPPLQVIASAAPESPAVPLTSDDVELPPARLDTKPTAPSVLAPQPRSEESPATLTALSSVPTSIEVSGVEAPPALATELRPLSFDSEALSTRQPPAPTPSLTGTIAESEAIAPPSHAEPLSSPAPLTSARRPSAPASTARSDEPAPHASAAVPSSPVTATLTPSLPSSTLMATPASTVSPMIPAMVSPTALSTGATALLLDDARIEADSIRSAAPSLAESRRDDAPRLPTAPVPLEDFAQRDQSARDELVQKLGGSEETEKAVGLALEWLRRRQSADGRWSSRGTGGTVDADAAMTGLALLTFLGAGHTHLADGPYREVVERGVTWLTRRTRADGDLRRDPGDDGRGPADTMYGQTIATVALCEAYAMTRDEKLAEPTRRTIDFVLARAAEARRGSASKSDTAVLGWLVMTVESARRAGFDPPPAVFESARAWLDTVAASRHRGRYAYAPGQSPSPAMTAEAMFVQQLLGRAAEDPRMLESAEFVAATVPTWSSDAPTHHWYYATLALFQHQGEPWKRWNEALARELVAHQRTDGPEAGSWDPQDRWSRAGGRVYQTAVCALSLEVYYRYRVPSTAIGSPP
jgi:WD40-like Beta Propeller Repeat